MATYWILFGAVAIVSYIVQASLQRKFERYSQIRIGGGLTGRDVAEKMLRDHGITDVNVISTSGSLTDHYNPTNKTVNLSETVYGTCSVAAAAVAAHECGHAVQHATGYAFIKLRTALVPVVSFSSKALSWVLLAGMLLINVLPQIMLLGVLLFAMTTLFSLVTLPVEFNASKRALAVLENRNLLFGDELSGARKVLSAAALTYVAALINTLLQMLRLILIVNRRND